MPDTIKHYWDILKDFTPCEVAKRCLIDYEDKQNKYKINFLNEVYSVSLNERKINSIYNNTEVSNFDLYLLILFYLVNAKQIDLSGEYVTCSGLKGADMFFTGSHELPTGKVAKIFGTNPVLFLNRGLMLGGKKSTFGDVAFELLPFSRIPVVYVLWKGDDELEADVSILFDKTIEIHFPLDIIHGLIKVVTKKLCNV